VKGIQRVKPGQKVEAEEAPAEPPPTTVRKPIAEPAATEPGATEPGASEIGAPASRPESPADPPVTDSQPQRTTKER
jgi:hypothetical protein